MTQLLFTIMVVLGLPSRNKDLIAWVKTLIVKMTGNAYFPTPSPSLSTVSTALADFESAETTMKTKKGVKGDRATKRRALVAVLKHLRDYVQGACEADPEHAAAIAESAGMRLMRFVAAAKAVFAVYQGPVSGSVVCDVKAPGIHATYYFSYSLDQKGWTRL
jgi:hypothetical protein